MGPRNVLPGRPQPAPDERLSHAGVRDVVAESGDRAGLGGLATAHLVLQLEFDAPPVVGLGHRRDYSLLAVAGRVVHVLADIEANRVGRRHRDQRSQHTAASPWY